MNRLELERLKSLLQTMIDHGIEGMPDQTIISWTTASIEHIEYLEAENTKLKESIKTYKFAIYDENSLEKLKAEGIREAATMCCPASGYVVRDEQARKDLLEYADFIEKQLPINLVENASDSTV